MQILETLLHALLHALKDTATVLPFLYLTFLLMEFLEHRAGGRMTRFLRRSGRFGPAIGAVLGAVPQCGFSSSVASLYAGRVVSLGTLMAIFLSTSDEMIPVALAHLRDGGGTVLWIFKVLLIKVVLGMAVGFAVDLLFRRRQEADVEDLCKEEGCHCERGIFLSALFHTLHVALFLFLVNLVLGGVVEFVGEDTLKAAFRSIPVVGQMISAAIGLIPNCAASVVITELYFDGVITAGTMLAGLLSGGGVGILVLFRTNRHHKKENLLILLSLFVLGALLGTLYDLLPFSGFLA